MSEETDLNPTEGSSEPRSASDAKIADLNAALKVAQLQFEKGSKGLLISIVLWCIINITLLIIAGHFACYLLNHSYCLPKEWTWQFIYFTAIRLSLFSALWTFIAYCLKMLNSYLHMYQFNKHRERIIKSAASFIHSGIVNDEEKQKMLYKFLDTILDFGLTGLVKKEEKDEISQKQLLDVLIKLVSKDNASSKKD